MTGTISCFPGNDFCGFVGGRMEHSDPKALPYKRARFVTQLPTSFLYSPSHYWIARQDDGLWRVGLTKFASRMLGEMVDYGVEVAAGNAVSSGQAIGWVEGFKALSDVFCIADGQFAGANPALESDVTLVNQDPQGAGWLYAVRGQPDATCVDAHGYAAVLDQTIDRFLENK